MSFFIRGDVKSLLFNRERLLLAAMQDINRLEMMLETREDGLFPSEVIDRRGRYGQNAVTLPLSRRRLILGGMKGTELDRYVREIGTRRISVVRKGMEPYAELEGSRLVPGDVVFLTEDDIVPADIRVIRADDLSLCQRLLDGQDAVVRREDRLPEGKGCATSPVTDLCDICLAGSVVVQGLMKGIVVSTGAATYLGKLLYGY